MLLDRIWPARKGQPVKVLMPPINGAQDLLPAIASIWSEVREGRLTYGESGQLLEFYEEGLQGYTYLEEPRER